MPVDNRAPGADSFPKKINIGRLVVVGNTAKDLGLKLSRKITMLSLVKMGWILHFEGVAFVPAPFRQLLLSC